jgi:hypothetical protein
MPFSQKTHANNIILIITTVFLVGIGITGTIHSAVEFLQTDLPFTEIPLSLMKIYACIIVPIIIFLVIYDHLRQ